MSVPQPLRRLARALPIFIGVMACADEAIETEAPCAIEPLATCVLEYSDALGACYAADGATCAEGEAGTVAALDTLASTLGDCSVAGLDAEATTGRLQNACASEASSIAWRAFGGPHGASWAAATADQQACLTGAHTAAAGLAEASLGAIAGCYGGSECNVGQLQTTRDDLEAGARETVSAACPLLSNLVGLDVDTFVDRAAHQVDCLAAAAFDAPADLELACGPSFAQFDVPRGEWTQVPVDSEVWGSQCGDGSDYAFWVYLAPEGERLDRVVVGLQGGGVCLFEEDCAARFDSNPGLYSATDDMPIDAGVVSNDPEVSAFASWSKVYLPYCNQDVFAGGGVVEELGSVSVPRFGAVNLRAALQMFRDVLWREIDAEGEAGFRSDEVVALFGGFSAGGYGTLYNYHWMIDDLQWPRTAAYPDAGLALDNGLATSVRGLGLLKIPAWGTSPYLAPYCFASECAAGIEIIEAFSPRLGQVPEQQMLLLSNQHDETQQRDAFFEDTPSFVNVMRETYCDTKDLDAIQWYLTSVSSEPVHVVSIRPERWAAEVAGEAMADWFQRAIEMPDTLEDRAEEADFVDVFDGVQPFPCDVAP
ncbi:MAG: pectin acetylesterase-family hydrolase [Myxococcota bacterium]